MSEHKEDAMNKGTMTNSNLKPCPHCGENAWYRAIEIGKSAISVIECTSCGASSNNEDQWNKRTTDPLRAALRDCLYQMECIPKSAVSPDFIAAIDDGRKALEE